MIMVSELIFFSSGLVVGIIFRKPIGRFLENSLKYVQSKMKDT